MAAHWLRTDPAHLVKEGAQEVHRQASKGVPLDQLVQVYVEQLKHEAQVPAAVKKVQHAYYVVLVVGVGALVQVLQDPNLNLRLQVRILDKALVPSQATLSLQQRGSCAAHSGLRLRAQRSRHGLQ